MEKLGKHDYMLPLQRRDIRKKTKKSNTIVEFELENTTKFSEFNKLVRYAINHGAVKCTVGRKDSRFRITMRFVPEPKYIQVKSPNR